MSRSSQLPSAMPPQTPAAIRLLSLLWPAFLMAGVTEIVVFAMVDPEQLHWPAGQTLALSGKGIYTVAFFAFWFINAVSAALAVQLAKPRDHPERTLSAVSKKGG